jgi:alcohol dehydrogenase
VDDKTAAEKCCDEIDSFLKKIGLWSNLEEKNVSIDDFGSIVEDTLKLRNYSLHPKIATSENVMDLLNRSYKRN